MQAFGYVPTRERLANRTMVPEPSGRSVPANSRDAVTACARWVTFYVDQYERYLTYMERAETDTGATDATYIQVTDRIAAAFDALATAMDSFGLLTTEQLPPSVVSSLPSQMPIDGVRSSLRRPDELRRAAVAFRNRNLRMCADQGYDTAHATEIDYRERTPNPAIQTMGFLPALLVAHPIMTIVMGTVVATGAVIGVAYVLTMTVQQVLNFFDSDRVTTAAAVDVVRETVDAQLRGCRDIQDGRARQDCIVQVGETAIRQLEQIGNRMNGGFRRYAKLLVAGGVAIGVAYVVFRPRKNANREQIPDRSQRFAGNKPPKRRRRLTLSVG
jgi:hypothetical protein